MLGDFNIHLLYLTSLPHFEPWDLAKIGTYGEGSNLKFCKVVILESCKLEVYKSKVSYQLYFIIVNSKQI